MREIAGAIQEGAVAFLRRQFKTIAIIVVPLFVLVFFTATQVDRPNGTVVLTFVQSGLARAIAFLCGAAFSGFTGFIGMSLSVRGNVRTAAVVREGAPPTCAQGGLPHRRHHRSVLRRSRPHWRNDDRLHLPEQRHSGARRVRVRWRR